MANYKIFKKALNLVESDIRFAMAHTKTNRAAARFIGCTINTYKKYASMYLDSASGKTLYDLHTNVGAKGTKKKAHGTKFEIANVLEILDGKHPDFPAEKLKSKILQNGVMLEECEDCGFSERRFTDGSVPLLLIWKDGDFKNHKRDNLGLICYNCYFLTYDDVFNKSESIDKKCQGYYHEIR